MDLCSLPESADGNHVMGNSSYLDVMLMVTVMMEPRLQHL